MISEPRKGFFNWIGASGAYDPTDLGSQFPHVIGVKQTGSLALDLDLQSAVSTAKLAASQAGEILLSMRGSATVHTKSGKDLVTDADLAAQIAICQSLGKAYPEHGFLGEEGAVGILESQKLGLQRSPYCWVVDPLDGTTNYAHGFPQYAVSIALTYERHPVLGVIFDPEAKEMFTAVKGQGALLNDRSIRTSARSELSQSLVAAGLSPNLKEGSIEIRNVNRMLLASQGLRRLGSAALNLCNVAFGLVDGYWGGTLKRWDIAAGVLQGIEAQGVVTDTKGDDQRALEGALIAASTRDLQRQISQVIAD
ncbi:MAG: inositol monophosphatase family protein [Pirellula sp.]